MEVEKEVEKPVELEEVEIEDKAVIEAAAKPDS